MDGSVIPISNRNIRNFSVSESRTVELDKKKEKLICTNKCVKTVVCSLSRRKRRERKEGNEILSKRKFHWRYTLHNGIPFSFT